MVRTVVAVIVLLAISARAESPVAAKCRNHQPRRPYPTGRVHRDCSSRQNQLEHTSPSTTSSNGDRPGGLERSSRRPRELRGGPDLDLRYLGREEERRGRCVHPRRQVASRGPGRMPVFTRDGRRLAAIWNDVRLPADIITEDGPEPEYQFIRAASVNGLRGAIAKMPSATSDAR